MKKNLDILIFLLVFYSNGFCQYVTLEGRQFRLGNTSFYPIVMNYCVSIVHNKGTSYYYGSPDSNYGYSIQLECGDIVTCNTRFQEDLLKMTQMGFNAVRVGFGPVFWMEQGSNLRKFSMAYCDKAPDQWNEHTQYRDLSYPDFNDQPSEDFFNIILNFLNQANNFGIKVILITCEDNGEKLSNGLYYTPVYDSQASDSYSVYLSKLAAKLYNHPALLAYDLWNEPLYSHMNEDINGTLHKKDICAYVSNWYDSIKLYDQNHLITLGGSSTDEIFYWDMSCLKLDFYSVHIYPGYSNYATDIQTGILDGMEVFRIKCYWMNQVCPIPWIIGETGFAADDNTYPAPHLSSDPLSKLPPYMNGSEEQQTQFAQISLNAVRDANASGYSWWAFQNVKWYSPSSENWEDIAKEDFFGLLHFGVDPVMWFDKQAVSVFQNYILAQPVPLEQPLYYFDPNKIKLNLNTSSVNAVTGTIYDNDGHPIKDAVIRAKNWLKTIDINETPNNIFDDEFKYNDISTFSHADGSFEIVPYNYEQPNIYNPHRIINLVISYPGAENQLYGTDWIYQHGYGEEQMDTYVGDIYLKKVYYDAVVNNEIVNQGEIKNYKGRKSLTVSNTIIKNGGISDFSSSQIVRLLPGFHSENGSNSDVHITQILPDCSDFNNFRIKSIAADSTENAGEYYNYKTIELKFVKNPEFEVRLFPNPNKGTFTIFVFNNQLSYIALRIVNMFGKLLWSGSYLDNEIHLNVEFLSSGIYYVQIINNNNRTIIKKLIIIH